MTGLGWPRRWARAMRRWMPAVPSNLGLGLLSLGLAVMVWVFVTNSENPADSRSFEVRLEATNIPGGLVASTISPERVLVSVTGPQNVVRRLRQDEIVAQLDLSGAGADPAGPNSFVVTRAVRADIRGRRDRRVQLEPAIAQANVTLERLERKEVRVDVKKVGVTPVGYEAEIGAPDPPRVTVEGTGPNIKAVDYVSAEVNLDGQTVPISPTVPLEARDSAGRTIGRVTIQPNTATVKVNIKQTLYSKDVLVRVRWRGRPKTGFTVGTFRTDPPLVTVVGPLDQVNTLAVSTDEIDIEGADRDVVRPVRLRLPQGLTTSQQNVVAFITIQPVSSVTTYAVGPRVVNVAPGLTPQLVTPVLAVTLRGPLGELVQLRPTDISATVDVAGLGAGTYRIEPKLTFPPTLQLDSLVPDKVEVVLK